jgi:hypothetical protein
MFVLPSFSHVSHGPSGLRTTELKKGLAALGTQLGSLVSKVRSRITEVPIRHANRRRHHNMQDV